MLAKTRKKTVNTINNKNEKPQKKDEFGFPHLISMNRKMIDSYVTQTNKN